MLCADEQSGAFCAAGLPSLFSRARSPAVVAAPRRRRPSALDPASMAPASSIIYISASIRPQGTLAQNLGKVIDDVAGPSAASELVSKVTSGSGSAQQTWKQVKPWLGQQVGAALIGLPPRAADRASAAQLRTADPANQRPERRQVLPLVEKLGNSTTAVTYKIVGDYALVGRAFCRTDGERRDRARTALAGSLAYRKLHESGGSGRLRLLLSACLPVPDIRAQGC